MCKVVEKVIDGVSYKAQFKGMGYAYALRDKARIEKSEYRLTKILFDEILISPNIDIDDFTDLDALERVRSFLFDVALGNIERIPSERKLKKIVSSEWSCWRLIFYENGAFDYNTVFNEMTPLEIEKANVAADKVIAAQKRAARRKR